MFFPHLWHHPFSSLRWWSFWIHTIASAISMPFGQRQVVRCNLFIWRGKRRETLHYYRLVNSKNDTYTLAQLVVHIYFGIIGAGTIFTMQHIGKYWITVEVNGQQVFPQAGWTDQTVKKIIQVMARWDGMGKFSHSSRINMSFSWHTRRHHHHDPHWSLSLVSHFSWLGCVPSDRQVRGWNCWIDWLYWQVRGLGWRFIVNWNLLMKHVHTLYYLTGVCYMISFRICFVPSRYHAGNVVANLKGIIALFREPAHQVTGKRLGHIWLRVILKKKSPSNLWVSPPGFPHVRWTHFFKWNFQRPPPAATPRWAWSSPQICEATDSFGTMDAENRHLGCFRNGLGSRWVAEVRNKWLGVLDGEADISWFGAPVWGILMV